MRLVLKKPGPILEECHPTFPDSQKEWTSLGARGLDRTARPESQAWLSRARHHSGPGLTRQAGRCPRHAVAPASAAVAPQALQWPASAAVGPARLQGPARPQGPGPGQAAVTAAGCGARRPKPMSLRSRQSRALGPAPSTRPQAQAGSAMASVSLELIAVAGMQRSRGVHPREPAPFRPCRGLSQRRRP